MANAPDSSSEAGVDTVTLPVYREQLEVTTRTVDTGRGVRVHKRVREQLHEIDQALWREQLEVRHVPVEQVVDTPPAARYEGDTFILPVLEEVLVLAKRYRVKEELHITRRRHASRHREAVPLRAEQVEVERFGDGHGEPTPSSTLAKDATMDHTLAAVFEHRGDADRVKSALLNAGFRGEDVRLASGAGGEAPQTDDSISGSIMHFFSGIFGSDQETSADKQLYSSAIGRGQTALSVDCRSDDEIELATGIIESFGPLSLDDEQGPHSTTQATPMAAAPSTYQGMQGSAQQGASPGAQQSATLGGSLGGSVGGSLGTAVGDQQGMQQSMSQNAQRDIQSAGMAGGAGQAQGQGTMQRATTSEQTIPVVQEELKVGKRAVQRGGVRVYQRVVETPVQENLTLREEHVVVDRHPVDQAITPEQVPAFEEKSFELREHAEEAVVQKTARIVEEVVVGKEVSQREQQISDTVRSTEVEVAPLSMDHDSHFRSHWQSNYASAGGTYDEYDPAYRYGSTMASRDIYQGRPWDEVEPSLRSDWESNYPQSGWDKFKAAVREGWDRMTS